MKNFSFKKILPYLIAVVVFMTLAAIYSSPVFEGKRLKQNDLLQGQGMSKELKDFHETTGEGDYIDYVEVKTENNKID